MLRTFVPQLRTKVFMRDCPRGNKVQEHHCRVQCAVLGDCSDTSASRGTSHAMYLDIIHHFEDVMFQDGQQKRYFAFADLLDTIADMYNGDTALSGADLFICTAPLMCSLLRSLSDKPLLAYLGMQLHVRVDEQKDQLLLMHFKEMSKNLFQNVFAVHNFAMREQIAFATGVRLDVVRPHSLYVFPRKFRRADVYSRRGLARGYWASRPQRHRHVLFYRSKYFATSLVVPMLGHYLDAFSLSTGRAYPLKTVLVTNSSVFFPFSVIQRFGAAVVFPWDVAPMAFYELYSLAGPVIYLPDPPWLWKIQQFAGCIFSDPIGAIELRGLQRVIAGRDVQHEYSPWWDAATAPPEQVLYWYKFSDLARFPHVQQFSSIPSLLAQLLDSQGRRHIRDGMRRHNANTLAVSLQWYRSHLRRLLWAKD